MQVYSYSV